MNDGVRLSGGSRKSDFRLHAGETSSKRGGLERRIIRCCYRKKRIRGMEWRGRLKLAGSSDKDGSVVHRDGGGVMHNSSSPPSISSIVTCFAPGLSILWQPNCSSFPVSDGSVRDYLTTPLSVRPVFFATMSVKHFDKRYLQEHSVISQTAPSPTRPDHPLNHLLHPLSAP